MFINYFILSGLNPGGFYVVYRSTASNVKLLEKVKWSGIEHNARYNHISDEFNNKIRDWSHQAYVSTYRISTQAAYIVLPLPQNPAVTSQVVLEMLPSQDTDFYMVAMDMHIMPSCPDDMNGAI